MIAIPHWNKLSSGNLFVNTTTNLSCMHVWYEGLSLCITGSFFLCKPDEVNTPLPSSSHTSTGIEWEISLSLCFSLNIHVRREYHTGSHRCAYFFHFSYVRERGNIGSLYGAFCHKPPTGIPPNAEKKNVWHTFLLHFFIFYILLTGHGESKIFKMQKICRITFLQGQKFSRPLATSGQVRTVLESMWLP